MDGGVAHVFELYHGAAGVEVVPRMSVGLKAVSLGGNPGYSGAALYLSGTDIRRLIAVLTEAVPLLVSNLSIDNVRT